MKRWLLFITMFVAMGSFAQNVKTYIPPQAFTHKETIRNELNEYFANIYDYNYVPALIEHESCISLKHSKCWNSQSKLSTKRELGIGLGQVTKAYHPDGSVRFDSLSNMKAIYKQELKEASWSNIQYKPNVQIRIIVLMLRDDFKKLYSVKDEKVRLQMTDSSYNGGIRDVHLARRACGLAKGCDPQLWFDHTEKHSVKSTRILYGNRSARDINNYHVRDVFFTRLPKYQKQYFTDKDNL